MTDAQTERFVVALETIAASLSQGTMTTDVAPEKPATIEKLPTEPAKKAASSSKKKEEPKVEPKEDQSVTISMLTTLARKLVRSTKKAQIIDLLEARGIAKISATPKDQWSEVFEELTNIDENE